ncbi:MAG: alpha/beta hydrolase [Rhodospirillaceae bacterium]|jgi:hypothetical protein|nr:alpha/beta hydrolase [Rhodospirillaceae bacterium]MBT5667014.1 alpha/beta hydrolase [Rhodospirillaceae bacterium]
MVFRSRAGAKAPALFFALAFVLSACTTVSILQSRPERADTLAVKNNWRLSAYHTPHFKIIAYRPASFERMAASKAPTDTLNVYLEGDGLAWITETRLSRDPTPSEPITLELAVQDPNPRSIYFARPCQYLTPNDLAQCSPAYWSSHRYSEEVVASMSDAVEQAKRESGARRVRLFGYSGGGALAVLIAARRTDVIGVTTLAANLDHQFWTQQGGMTPLYGSLNPAHVANEISHIPQIHFIGEDDETVPNSVAYAYMSDIKDTSRIRIVKLPDMDHTCCWVEPWKNLLRNYVNR